VARAIERDDAQAEGCGEGVEVHAFDARAREAVLVEDYGAGGGAELGVTESATGGEEECGCCGVVGRWWCSLWLGMQRC
jgi:hypothetical protein